MILTIRSSSIQFNEHRTIPQQSFRWLKLEMSMDIRYPLIHVDFFSFKLEYEKILIYMGTDFGEVLPPLGMVDLGIEKQNPNTIIHV